MNNSDVRDTLLLAGGAALVIFGAGLILANARIRQSVLGSVTPLLSGLGEANESAGGGLFPDVERYMRLKAM